MFLFSFPLCLEKVILVSINSTTLVLEFPLVRYVLEGKSMEEVRVPAQACWMVRKVLGAKKMLHIFHNEAAWNESMIRQACKQILGSFFEGRMDKSYLF